jgi:uncharacterized protein YegL
MDTMIAPDPEDLLPFEEPDWGELLVETSREFVDNPEPRCPFVLLLDTSSSMAGAPLAALNEGVRLFHEELQTDPLARQRVELALVTFGSPVEVVQSFVAPDAFRAPVLEPRGLTPLGTGLLRALDLVEARKSEYRAAGVSYSRPAILLVSDGMPQGEPWEVTREALRRMKADETAKRAMLFAVGVDGANLRFLSRLSSRPALALAGLRFVDLFLWLSASAGSLARAPADEHLEFSPNDWGAA